uniref:Chemosensory protein 7 n=1 Tax=Dastarcus helophoroides TaxID=1169899 RepID=A0A1I9HZN2_9CUCU|nr:chemosensory protein 7 [Dastarcus helophoroides]
MKTVLLSLICSLVLVLVASEDKYTTKYDNIDVDGILTNHRLFDNYVKCLLGRGKCSEDGATLKKYIPDALLTECAKCSALQKKHGEKVLRFMYKNRRDAWDSLLKVYDPESKYQSSYRKYIDELEAPKD